MVTSKTLCAAVFAAACAALPAGAATLTSIAPGQGTEIFTTEFKRDENTLGNQQRGHDIFLRNAGEFAGESTTLDWAGSGRRYDWSIGYDGDVATLLFRAGRSEIIRQTLDVTPDGHWNAFQFFISARDRGNNPLFTTASTSVTVTSVNGMATSTTAQATKGVDGGVTDVAFWLGGEKIEQITGSMTFDFGTTDANGSPNSRLAVNVKALEVAPVPVPAALPMLLAGLGGLAYVGRRRKRAA
jgi:hypothetical protein